MGCDVEAQPHDERGVKDAEGERSDALTPKE